MAKLQTVATPDQVLANVNQWRKAHKKPLVTKSRQYPYLERSKMKGGNHATHRL